MSVSAFPYGALGATGGSGATVSWNGHDIDNNRIGDICYALWRLDSDGEKYATSASGTYSQYWTWLLTGNNDDVWVERTINSETGDGLTTDTIGAGRVICSSDRTLGTARTSVGVNTANVTVELFDRASGGSPIASAVLTVSARYEFPE